MELLKTLLWIVNLLSAVAVIVLVLLQHGKGADMGAAFGGGGGSSGSLFGASGSSNFMSRSTAVLAVVFFSTCLALSYLSIERQNDLGVMGGVQQSAPQVPGGAADNNKPGPAIPE
ncbi:MULTISPECIES: preprotein translocase subunit SecG [Crenobacter]|uniref:Protein-export membrane protein SecG n=2 Tax=Crenobacter TaxID=1654931 RepID=A0A4T0UZY7_9NEIS|nr:MULTISPECIES: preprotein translocase subunit SecG [Crenobacter]NDV11989.1 preprotein translocase subunit SecG [Crenobacter caeni]TIC84718.1 preprotein translocase subunit SecG [Crenobacter intestini]